MFDLCIFVISIFFLLDLYISKYLAFDTNRGSFTVYYENFFINQCNSNMFDMFE